jgi:dTDP-4-dehydrorhamnose 3,5-epimerase
MVVTGNALLLAKGRMFVLDPAAKIRSVASCAVQRLEKVGRCEVHGDRPVFVQGITGAKPGKRRLIMSSMVQSFIDGDIDGVVMRPLTFFHDSRGWLVELFRHDELGKAWWPVMSYVSQTLPGVSRGPHEHADQTDGFAFIGPSDFKLFLWDTRRESPTCGQRTVIVVGESNPAAVWVPPGVVHAYRNVGAVPGLVFNAPNRLYGGWAKKEPVDEIRHEKDAPRRFPMD